MKYMYFQALSIGHQNEQILTNFQEIAFHHLVYLNQKLWILKKLTNLSDLTEITDSNGFSKRVFYRFQFLHRKLSIFIK